MTRSTAIERVERWLAGGVSAVRLPGGDWLLPTHFAEVVALAKRGQFFRDRGVAADA